jgi:hypothetical protein
MSSGIATGPFEIVKVAANRFNVVDTRTGKVVTLVPKTKYMAEKHAQGCNSLASKPQWCASHRYESEFAPSILCGATVPAHGTCPRVHEHVTAAPPVEAPTHGSWTGVTSHPGADPATCQLCVNGLAYEAMVTKEAS